MIFKLKKKNIKKRKKQIPDIKSTTNNFFLNIIIFLLAAIVIFVSYSLFIKITDQSVNKNTEAKKQTASEVIQVEVLNGCGVAGVADRFTDFLREHKFDVVNVGNYFTFNVDETIVVDRIGNLENARKVARSLGIQRTNVVQQLNNNYFLDVSIIIGKNYYKLKPIKEE